MNFFKTLLLFPFLVLATTNAPKYVGHNSTEAHVDFNAFLEVQASGLTSTELKQKVYTNSKYLVGPMKSALYPASLLGGYKVKVIRVEALAEKSRVHYNISGKMVLKNGIEGEYKFYVLNNPESAKNKGVSCNPRGNPFWYRWTPGAHCELEEGIDYQVIKMPIQRISNSETSYPEYKKLINKNKEIRIDLYFGMARYNSFPWNPDESRDANAREYRSVRNYLLGLGYNLEIWNHKKIESIYTPIDGNYPHVEELTFQGDIAKTRVRMFFADTGYYYTSKAFHHFLQDGVKNASILMYGGHSGLGANFNLPAIAQKSGLNMDASKKKYQIFVIESCVPYAYYTQMLHDWKKSRHDKLGTKYLEVLSTGGDVISFSDIGRDMVKLLTFFHNYSDQGLEASYQDITSKVHFDRALFGVSGDEDNPSSTSSK